VKFKLFKQFKLSDLWATIYITAITSFLVLKTAEFVSLTRTFPELMGFLKIALLGTFGECLKRRMTVKSWIPEQLIVRAVVWGGFGIWFTSIFPFCDGGVTTLINQGLWLKGPEFWLAFSKSFWANIGSGFLFFMMFVHYWIDIMLARKTFLWPWDRDVIGNPKAAKWAKVVMPSMVLFWVPAHTITFCLPPEWRVISAAVLAIALGFILSLAASKKEGV